jgi:hypothetical protein
MKWWPYWWVDCSFFAGFGRRKVPQLEYPRTTPFCDRMIAPAVLAILPLVSHRFICAQWRGSYRTPSLRRGGQAGPVHALSALVRTRANSRHDIPLRSFHTASLPGCECVFQRYALTDGCRCTTLRRENVQFSGKVRDTQTHPTAGRSWRCIISQSSEVRNTCQLSLPPPTATYPKWPLDLVLRALRAN